MGKRGEVENEDCVCSGQMLSAGISIGRMKLYIGESGAQKCWVKVSVKSIANVLTFDAMRARLSPHSRLRMRLLESARLDDVTWDL